MLLRKVKSAKAHIVPHGENQKFYELLAARTNEEDRTWGNATRKVVQNRVRCLQSSLTITNKCESCATGIDEKVGDMEELLESMRGEKLTLYVV